MHSNSQIIRFVLIMTTVVAFVLALLATGLKPMHEKNAALYNRKAILSSVDYEMPKPVAEMTDEQVAEMFENEIEAMALNAQGEVVGEEEIVAAGYPKGNVDAIDPVKEKKKAESERLYPLFVYTKDSGKKFYITSMAGAGLWDVIWGNISFEEDLRTIAGTSFDHKGETPGLGAEIKDNQDWKDQFIGKMVYDEEMNLRGIDVMKSVVLNPEYEVDGISGATITSKGVEDMIDNGLNVYESYFLKEGLIKK